MAVPSSGELSLLGLWCEKNENDYTAANPDGETDFSLRGISDSTNDDSSGGNINVNTANNPLSNRPNLTAPHAMSEFYSYDHDASKSDRRLKTNIEMIGHSPSNIPIYTFNYKTDLTIRYKGVMAQDLLEMGITEPVTMGDDGFYGVDYNKIDVDMEIIN